MNYWWSVLVGSVAAAVLWALLDRLGWASWAFYVESALLFPLLLMACKTAWYVSPDEDPKKRTDQEQSRG